MVEFGHVYIDSSVILRRVLNQPGALRDVKFRSAIASELAAVELLRTLDNMRIAAPPPDEEWARIRGIADKSLTEIDLVPLADIVLKRARASFPTPIRTLDAIHLATALLWAEYVESGLVVLTHDRQFSVAARSSGLAVYPDLIS